MPQTIVRFYISYEIANAAVAELHENGFKAYVVEGEKAGIYAEHIQRGEVPVFVVDPPFGSARYATDILENHRPVKADLSAIETSQYGHSPTPLSSLLGLGVLFENPAPLSSMLGLKLLFR